MDEKSSLVSISLDDETSPYDTHHLSGGDGDDGRRRPREGYLDDLYTPTWGGLQASLPLRTPPQRRGYIGRPLHRGAQRRRPTTHHRSPTPSRAPTRNMLSNEYKLFDRLADII
jgi:hypothetical protein